MTNEGRTFYTIFLTKKENFNNVKLTIDRYAFLSMCRNGLGQSEDAIPKHFVTDYLMATKKIKWKIWQLKWLK